MQSFQERYLLNRFGKVPDGWSIQRLGNIFSERTDTSNDTKGYPLCSLTIESGVVPKTERYDRTFLLKDEENNEYRMVYTDDCVFNPMNLRFGAIAFSKLPEPVTVSAYYNVLTLEKPDINIVFLESVLKCYPMIDLYDRVAIGSLFEKRRVHWSEFKNLCILIPPPNEQKRIGDIFSCWNKVIAKTEQLIIAKQKFKKGLMQQLLTGKKRFSQFSLKWRQSQLSDLAEVIVSNVDKKLNSEEISVLLCNYLDVYRNHYITNHLNFMEGRATKAEIEKFRLQIGDVIITKDSETPDDIANAATVIGKLKNVICGYHLAILRSKQEVLNGMYLGHYLMLPSVRYQFTRVANGVTRFGLTVSSIEEVLIKYPPLDEQRRIAQVLTNCDKEIELLNSKVKLMKQQKKGLMQKLMTGKVRVKV